MTNLRRKNKFKNVLDIFINILGMAVLFTLVWSCFIGITFSQGFFIKKGRSISQNPRQPSRLTRADKNGRNIVKNSVSAVTLFKNRGKA
jgi:hypothetical protein